MVIDYYPTLFSICCWPRPLQGPHIGLSHHRLHPHPRPSHSGPRLLGPQRVHFQVALLSPITESQVLISFRNLKNFDSTSFTHHPQLLSKQPPGLTGAYKDGSSLVTSHNYGEETKKNVWLVKKKIEILGFRL